LTVKKIVNSALQSVVLTKKRLEELTTYVKHAQNKEISYSIFVMLALSHSIRTYAKRPVENIRK
jgi:hypothetical protein